MEKMETEFNVILKENSEVALMLQRDEIDEVRRIPKSRRKRDMLTERRVKNAEQSTSA